MYFAGTCISSLQHAFIFQAFRIFSTGYVFGKYLLQWNLDLTSLYLANSSVKRTIFFGLEKVTVKCMEQNLDLTNLNFTNSSI